MQSNTMQSVNEQQEALRRQIQSREIKQLKPINVGLNVAAGMAFAVAGASGLLATCLIGTEDETEIKDRRVLTAVAVASGLGGIAALRTNRHYAKKYARRMADASYVAGYRRGASEISSDLDDLYEAFQTVGDQVDTLVERLDRAQALAETTDQKQSRGITLISEPPSDIDEEDDPGEKFTRELHERFFSQPKVQEPQEASGAGLEIDLDSELAQTPSTPPHEPANLGELAQKLEQERQRKQNFNLRMAEARAQEAEQGTT